MDIGMFKNIIREYYVLHEYQKEGISHVSFILDREFKEQSNIINYNIEDYKWSYDNENAWGDQCNSKNKNGHIRSPIILDESLMKSDIELVGVDRKKQLEGIRARARAKRDAKVDDGDNDQSGYEISDEERTFLQNLYDDNLVKLQFKSPPDESADYLNIFTFNGLHENMFIGDFGGISLEFKNDE